MDKICSLPSTEHGPQISTTSSCSPYRRAKKDAPDAGGWNVYVTVAGQFDSDYAALIKSLGNESTTLNNEAATLNNEAATLNNEAAVLKRRGAALNVTVITRPANEALPGPGDAAA